MSTQHCLLRRAASRRAARSGTRIDAYHRQFASTFFNDGKTNTRQVRSILPPAEMSSEVHRFLDDGVVAVGAVLKPGLLRADVF